MPHPAVGFALLVGIAIGGVLYLLLNNQENFQQQQPHSTYIPPTVEPPYKSQPRSRQQRRRRKNIQDCLICFKPLVVEIKELKCNHSFHESCIKLFQQNQTKVCPMPTCDEKFNINECSICWEPMEQYNKKTLKCGHSYHPNCIANWFKESKICPLRC